MTALSRDIAAAIADPKLGPHTWKAYTSGGKWRPARHLVHIGSVIAAGIVRGDARILINAPPGSGKSELCSEAVPEWFLERWPAGRIIHGSGTPDLPAKFGGAVRDELTQNPAFTVRIKSNSKAREQWETIEGGGMKASSVQSAVIGFRANLLIIDDPYGSWAQSSSRTHRKRVEDWYEAVASSRLEPGASVIVVHHRMHPEDFTNYLLKGEGGQRWKHLSFPSIATGPDILGREKGDPLWPERYGLDRLDRIKLDMRYKFEPMHQQNPAALVAGRLYRAFTVENEGPVELVKGHDVDLCVDFNINPGMHMIVGQHFKLDDTFRYTNEIHGPRMNLAQACAEFVKLWNTLPWKPAVRLFGDASGNAANLADGRSNWTLLKVALKAAGITTRDLVPFSNPGVIDSVNSLNEALCDSVTGARRAKINPRCERLLTDLREVQADEDGKPDKTDDELTHASDCVRYHVQFLSPVRERRERTKGRIG